MVDSLCMYLITQGDKTPTEQITPIVLVIDEIRWVATVRKTKSENLLLLARGHRNVNVVLIGTTQSYGDLSRDLTCSVTQHRIYRCSAGQDIRRLKADINPEVAARVKNLWKPPENSGAKEGEFVTYP
jgi:hypothetical protein